MTLSDKIKPHCRQILSVYHHDKPMILVKDVKEAVKELEQEFIEGKDYCGTDIKMKIEKIFGWDENGKELIK